MLLVRREFVTSEELEKFKRENTNIVVKGIYAEDRNGSTILVMNYIRK